MGRIWRKFGLFYARAPCFEMDHPVVLIQCPLEHHGGHKLVHALSAGATIVIWEVRCARSDQIDEAWGDAYDFAAADDLRSPRPRWRRVVARFVDRSHCAKRGGRHDARNRRAIYGAFPNAEINYGWGQSESGSGITMRLTREMLEEDSRCSMHLASRMDEMEIRIVDDEGDDGAGEPGEALVKSPR